MPHKFRFGVQTSSAPSREAWMQRAHKLEDLGFSTLFIPDHFHDQLAPVPALMAAADATSTLRIGGMVFDNDYRHPVVFAKECATMDVLSDGRYELGIGAGWMQTDYDASGIAYDRPGVRIERRGGLNRAGRLRLLARVCTAASGGGRAHQSSPLAQGPGWISHRSANRCSCRKPH